MKHPASFLLLAIILSATFAVAASNNIPQVQHVIIVIQENRTPDNLFYEDSTLWNNGNGGHVRPPGVTTAPCDNPANPTITLQPVNLFTCWDTWHSHSQAYSLYDFFDFTKPPHAFQNIQGAKYPSTCFHSPNQTACFPNSYPLDPDNDANE